MVASLGVSIELAKGLLKVKEIADSAEAKMAIADLTSQLAESRIHIAELKVEQLAKDDAIRELETKLAQRAELIRHNEMYFAADKNGNPEGDPYCPRCLEANDKLVHLVYLSDSHVKCPECDNRHERVPGSNSAFSGVAIARRRNLLDDYY